MDSREPLTRSLGVPGLSTFPVGFGCMGLSQGYGPADDDESLATLTATFEAGTRLFDTAMSYGEGHNESLLGQFIRQAARDEFQVATKVGIVRGPNGARLDAHPAAVKGYLTSSLRRLGLQHIDLYYLHRVDPAVPVEDSIGAMADLVSAGLVRQVGICEVTPEELRRAHAVHPICAAQFEWSLAWREPERDVIPVARELGVGLVPYSPLGRGLLAGGLTTDSVAESPFRANDPRFSGEAWTANAAQATALSGLAQEWGVTAAQLALAWLLDQGPDVVPIPGSRRPERARANADAARIALSGNDRERLNAACPPSGWRGDRASFAVPVTARTQLGA